MPEYYFWIIADLILGVFWLVHWKIYNIAAFVHGVDLMIHTMKYLKAPFFLMYKIRLTTYVTKTNPTQNENNLRFYNVSGFYLEKQDSGTWFVNNSRLEV